MDPMHVHEKSGTGGFLIRVAVERFVEPKLGYILQDRAGSRSTAKLERLQRLSKAILLKCLIPKEISITKKSTVASEFPAPAKTQAETLLDVKRFAAPVVLSSISACHDAKVLTSNLRMQNA